jgi:hypothetical protein
MIRNLSIIGFVAACVICPSGLAGASQWIPLFDGQTHKGGTSLDGQPPGSGWQVIDGTLHLDPAGGRSGDIVTDREFENYELLFEWKIAPGGNSGLKYRVKKFGNRTLGCEYQILGDEDKRPGWKGSTGSLYNIYGPLETKPLKPVGQYNRSLVVVRGNLIEHWLNGTRIVEARVGSDQWRAKIADSKFHDVEGFGENRFGKIMLTDHGSEVWYRNIFLRPLASTEPACAAAAVPRTFGPRGVLRRSGCGWRAAGNLLPRCP